MTPIDWTQTQKQRFKELGIDPEQKKPIAASSKDRDKEFQKIEKGQVQRLRKDLRHLLSHQKKSQIQALKERIESILYDHGFTGVTTPTIISKQALKKMTIGPDHPLYRQVFWLNDRQCLRPMLAPNLYSLMFDFSRLNQRPVRFFEIGSCFRKESSGARHANEFTMLNLVEMGSDEAALQGRLTELAGLIMDAAGIDTYEFETEGSEVYGSTLDVVAGDGKVEVASGATGPHPLDGNWGITDTWVGIGFGIERLQMVAAKDLSIGRWVKGLSYLDGICLNI